MVGHALGQSPVEDLARPGIVAVHHEEVGSELLEAPDARLPRVERLDHHRHPRSHPLRLLGRLVPVQLRRAQTGDPYRLDHPLRRLVTEDADGEDVLGQPLRDVARELHGHLARRRGEDEPHGRRPEADRRAARPPRR